MIKTILCAGCHRSGSTWLYNVVRSIYIQKEVPFQCGLPMNIKYSEEPNLHIIKLHPYRPNMLHDNTVVLTSIRDIRDIAASAVRRNMKIVQDNGEPTLDKMIIFLDSVVEYYDKWKPHSILELRFDDMMNNKHIMIQRIASALKSEVDVDKTFNYVESLKSPIDKADPITMLWPNHITSGRTGDYANLGEWIKIIEDRYSEFLQRTGYKKTRSFMML